MKLKTYQERAIDELKEFIINASTLKGDRGIRLAYLDQVGDEERHYKPISGIENAPFVCIKIPTGGGKTLVASHSLNIIFDNYLQDKNGKGLVMWFVPSDAIRTQTLDNLKNREHPYREIIDQNYGNDVKVYTLEESLAIQKHDLQNNLCIVVSSLQAFRRTDKNWLKVFQANGSLITHFENLVEDTDFLEKDEEGQIIYSLGNVIRINNPLVILDEGHNVQTSLSFDMLKDLNPSFILEYTATPRSESNVLVKVLASELKAEKMVKIPVFLSNVPQWQEAVRDGVIQRNELEKLSLKEKRQTKEYIRPICLLQAEQEKESGSKVYVEQIKNFLIKELKVNETEIAIKTAKNDEIKGIDLLSDNCPIRYILTVNALKEGWDCPFAYVLVSVSNIGSRIAVEQTMGRILRLPQAKEKQNIDLNYSYIYTSSESFSKASSAIIQGLEKNGYSRSDLKKSKGKITIEKISFDKFIKDENIRVPFIGIKSKGELLAFNRDLIGPEFKIYEQYAGLSIDFHDDQSQKIKIDIDEENGIYRVMQGKLMLILYKEDFSIEEVSNWLKVNIRHSVISSEEMNRFIDKIISDLSKEHSVQDLSLNRFRLKEKILEEIANIIATYAKNTFTILDKNNDIDTTSAFYTPDENILIARLSDERFQKHLFERAGVMNSEETEFAMRLDSLENIEWWYRNREKEDFYLQGWKPNKFYPDYIIKTKKGDYILAEYKGEDRITNEDTQYKVEIGNYWQKLSKEANRFILVSKANMDNSLKEISNL